MRSVWLSLQQRNCVSNRQFLLLLLLCIACPTSSRVAVLGHGSPPLPITSIPLLDAFLRHVVSYTIHPSPYRMFYITFCTTRVSFHNTNYCLMTCIWFDIWLKLFFVLFVETSSFLFPAQLSQSKC